MQENRDGAKDKLWKKKKKMLIFLDTEAPNNVTNARNPAKQLAFDQNTTASNDNSGSWTHPPHVLAHAIRQKGQTSSRTCPNWLL